MLKHTPPFSRDIRYFVSGSQYVTRILAAGQTIARKTNLQLYDEQHQYVKLYFPEG